MFRLPGCRYFTGFFGFLVNIKFALHCLRTHWTPGTHVGGDAFPRSREQFPRPQKKRVGE